MFQAALHLDYRDSFFWMKRAAEAGHELAQDILSSENRSAKAQIVFLHYFTCYNQQPTDDELVLCSPYLYYKAAWGNDFANDFVRLSFSKRGAELGCLKCMDEIGQCVPENINWPYFLASSISYDLDPHIWAKRVKMLEDWLGDLEWITLHEENWDGMIYKVNNHQAYFLGKFGCQFKGEMYSRDLRDLRHVAFHWFTRHYTRFTAAMITAALCLRQNSIPRDVRRLILWQCREADWISNEQYWKQAPASPDLF